MALDDPGAHKVLLHVLNADVDGEVVAESVTTPIFSFRVESGQAEKAAVLRCNQIAEERETAGVKYPVILVACPNLKMVLSGVDLNPSH